MRDDGCSRLLSCETGVVVACLREALIAAGVVFIHAGVYDEFNRLLRKRPDRRQNLLAHLRSAGVYEHDSLIAQLNRDI